MFTYRNYDGVLQALRVEKKRNSFNFKTLTFAKFTYVCDHV